MSVSNVEHHALEWLRYAERDLDQANKGVAPYLVCWLAEQAAEKAIKAGLVLEGVGFPRSHNLNELRDLLPPGWSIANTHPNQPVDGLGFGPAVSTYRSAGSDGSGRANGTTNRQRGC